MNIDYKFIKKKVKCLLKENGIVDKEKIDEFTETCNDDYNLGLENGLSENEAFNIALRMLDDSIEVKRYNKHSFIFRISIIFFVSSIILSMVGWLIADVLTIYGVLYPICFILSLVMIVLFLLHIKKEVSMTSLRQLS